MEQEEIPVNKKRGASVKMEEEEIRASKKKGPNFFTPATKQNKIFGQGMSLRGQSREIVYNVREYFNKEKANKGPLIPVNKVLERTAQAVQIHRNTVVRVCKEKEQQKLEEPGTSMLPTPGKKRKHEKRVTKLDAFEEAAIRRHIYEYYKRKECPTLKRILVSLGEIGLFGGGVSSLRLVLKDIGFYWCTVNGKKVIMERSDIAAWRCRFFRQIRKEDFSKIVWLGETWLNAGSNLKVSTVKTPQITQTGKGHMMICHAGSADGFVPNSLLLLKTKKADYQEEMDHTKFLKWCGETLLKNLNKNSVIVMDSSPCHSVVMDKAPTAKTPKDDVADWLERRNVKVNPEFKKAELLELVKTHESQTQTPEYLVDVLFQRNGHRVIRLPPNHNHFNAIEQIWAQVKGYVTENIRSSHLAELEKLIHEALKSITPEKWKSMVEHMRKKIEFARVNEEVIEEAVEDMIDSLTNSANNSSSSEFELSDSDCDPWEDSKELRLEDC